MVGENHHNIDDDGANVDADADDADDDDADETVNRHFFLRLPR